MLQSPFNSGAKHPGNPARVEKGTPRGAKTAGQLDQLGLQLAGGYTALLIHKDYQASAPSSWPACVRAKARSQIAHCQRLADAVSYPMTKRAGARK